MNEQIRAIIKNALDARQPADPDERKAIYDAVRKRLDRYITGRNVADEHKKRLHSTLERTITEIEERFSIQEQSSTPVSPSQDATQGDMNMTTSPQLEKASQSSGKRNAAVAAVAVVAVAAAASGWYWWGQQRLLSIAGTLNCEPVGNLPGFKRAWSVEIDGTNVAIRDGDWQNKIGFYDLWTGNLNNRQIELTGTYREGDDSIKEGALKGRYDGTSLRLDGKRGPRECSFSDQTGSSS